MAVVVYPGDNPSGYAEWGEIVGDVVDQPDVLASDFETSYLSFTPSDTDPLVFTRVVTNVFATADGEATDVGTASVAATADGDTTDVGTVVATATAEGTATDAGTIAATATADGEATDAGTIGETISIGSKVYTVVAAAPGVDEIAQGADAAEYAANIESQVNTDAAFTLCTVIATGADLAFTANDPGAAGNSITFSTTDPNLTLDGSFAGGVDAGTISIGSKVYTIVAGSPGFDEIAQGADASEYATNIANRVNADTSDTLCTVIDTTGDLDFTANTPGAAGNSITFSTTDPNLTLDGSFAGGADAGTISVGSKVYTVVASGATGDQINAGADATEYADNIATKVTADTADTLCTAVNTGTDLDFTANDVGTAGNSITLSTTDPNLTLGSFGGGASVTISVGSKVYTVVVSGASGDQINIGATPTEYADNIAAKVSLDVADTDCTAINTGADLDFTAAIAGTAGNSITLSTTDPDLTLGSFSGGVDASATPSTVTVGGIVEAGLGYIDVYGPGDTFNAANFIYGYASTATAAGTTTLTFESNQTQRFTGTTTQTVVLPVVSTLALNWTFLVLNDSTGIITVNSSGSNLVQTMAPGSSAEFTCIALTGTDATPWRVTYADPGDYTTTATAADTTTLTVSSTRQQYFTGSTTQTCVLPVVSTLRLGMGYRITNLSTGAITVNSSGGNLVYSLTAGQTIDVVCIAITGTDAASWNVVIVPQNATALPFTPAGSIAATNVQAAIEELDSEKLASTSLLRSYLASTVTYNNVDTLADTPLSVTVEAGGIYDIELTVHSDSAVEALLLDFGGTSTATNFIGQWMGVTFDDLAAASKAQRATTPGDDITFSVLNGASSYITFNGSIEVNAGGTFLLRGAQNGPDASETTILRGSTLILTKTN